MSAYDCKWFWLALVNVPVSNIALLRERELGALAVGTGVYGVNRYPGREKRVDRFGITRVTACVHPDGVYLHWYKKEPGRRDQPLSLVVPCTQHVHIQFPDHLVFAKAFTDEAAARDWARQKKSQPRTLAG